MTEDSSGIQGILPENKRQNRSAHIKMSVYMRMYRVFFYRRKRNDIIFNGLKEVMAWRFFYRF